MVRYDHFCTCVSSFWIEIQLADLCFVEIIAIDEDDRCVVGRQNGHSYFVLVHCVVYFVVFLLEK